METKTTSENAANALESTAQNAQHLAAKIDETIKRSQQHLNAMQDELADKTRYAAETANTFAHERPWQAIGYAAGIGFVLGLIMGRR